MRKHVFEEIEEKMFPGFKYIKVYKCKYCGEKISLNEGQLVTMPKDMARCSKGSLVLLEHLFAPFVEYNCLSEYLIFFYSISYYIELITAKYYLASI